MKALIISDLHSDDDFTEERLIKAKREIKPDVVFLLGDIKSTDLYKIEQTFYNDNIQIPIYGITGDDDTPNMFKNFKHITDIDGKIVDVCGFKVGGFSGSTVYKHGIFSMRTEDQANEILEKMGDCDIFLSHETGKGYMKKMIEKKEAADTEKVRMIEEKRAEINVKTGFQKFMDKLLRNKDEAIAEHKEVESVYAREDHMYDGFEAIDNYIRRVQPKVHIFGHYHLNNIEIADSAEIMQKTKRMHDKRDITIKTVKAKTHKELTAFDIGSTTCACNYLFGVLEIGERFSFLPIIVQEELDRKKEIEEKLEEQLFEDSYYVDLSPKERLLYNKEKEDKK